MAQLGWGQTHDRTTQARFWLASWLVPDPAAWVAICLYLGVWVSALVYRRADLTGGQLLGLTLALGALLVLNHWGSWRSGAARPTAQRWLFALQTLLVEAAVRAEGFELSAFLYLILPFSALLSFGRRAGVGCALLVWGWFAFKVLRTDPFAGAAESLAIFALAEALVVLISLLALRERQARAQAELLLAELSRANQQLADYAAGAAELATTRERTRLAREIHDGLGHALTALAIQLEQAEAFRARDAARADAAVRSAKQLADEALTAVRGAVGVLRLTLPPAGMLPALEALAAPLRPGLPALALRVSGDSAALAPQQQAAVLRIVQEGLTNVRRHARASRVSVQLVCAANLAVLTISDDGVGCALDERLAHAAGYGLRGIAERVAQLGGTFTVSSAAGRGTSLTISLPLAADAPSQQAAVAA